MNTEIVPTILSDLIYAICQGDHSDTDKAIYSVMGEAVDFPIGLPLRAAIREELS